MKNRFIEKGIIYRLTSPSNKVYIGQTIFTLKKRVIAHNSSAKKHTSGTGCPMLNKAIRKYGIDNFKQEVIHEFTNVTRKYFDEMEVMEIAKHNCIYPNGYNIAKGGSGLSRPKEHQTQEERQKRSDSLRKYSYKDIKLPMYVVYYNKPPCEGFRLNHPDAEKIIISTKKLSMDEKYELILSMLDMTPEQIKKIKDKRKERCRRDNKIDAGNEFKLPMYVTYQSGKYEGFSVRKPGFPMKKFSASSLTKTEKYDKAIQYLEYLNALEYIQNIGLDKFIDELIDEYEYNDAAEFINKIGLNSLYNQIINELK